MSSDIVVKVLRAGTVIYPNVSMQKDNMSQQEAAYYGGAAPYQRYAMYPLANLTILQQDLLVDLHNADPKTDTFAQYRVINDPEPFPDNHMELVVDKVRGT